VPELESYARKIVKLAPRFTALRIGSISAFLHHLYGRCRDALFLQSEVYFFGWTQGKGLHGQDGAGRSLRLTPINLELLSLGATIYVNEQETLAYLLRAAARLRSGKNIGFALVGADGRPLHFCWVADFEGFYMSELEHTLTADSTDSVLLFDCWTPTSVRGQNYYSIAISKLASQLSALGKRPWIFSAAVNLSSLRGVEKSGFVRRYSLIRKRMLFMNDRIHIQELVSPTVRTNVTSAA
jgi:hypothetical protein